MKLLPILVLATASFFIFGKLDSKYLLVEVEGGRGKEKGVAGTDGTNVAGVDYQGDPSCNECCFTGWQCPPYCDCDLHSLKKSKKTAGEARAMFGKKKKPKNKLKKLCKKCKKACKKGDCKVKGEDCKEKCHCCKVKEKGGKKWCKKVKPPGKCKGGKNVPWPGEDETTEKPDETTDEPDPEGEGEPDEGEGDDNDYANEEDSDEK